MNSRVTDPDEALYNLIADLDEKSNVYLDPEFQALLMICAIWRGIGLRVQA